MRFIVQVLLIKLPYDPNGVTSSIWASVLYPVKWMARDENGDDDDDNDNNN